MDTKTAATAPKKGKGHVRQPDEGNILWQLYSTLGSVRKAEFKQLLKDNKIPHSTFIVQTGRKYELRKMNAPTFLAYRAFFLESGVDLNDHLSREGAAPSAPAEPAAPAPSAPAAE